ncbi:hypothetical protein [Labrys monachus]|uniref:Uncharacterized membrane protein YhaH (DUF805 family) n=1 Tax=Labrys monachus TaxID=217067 RepID=A0ABU0FK54_9HYPH|nr:hypothetical protein [Labrys monachus]MDQ0394989.1 uncharacterized membrane protein YhaH (DUF805 family) [Labrys monachus]
MDSFSIWHWLILLIYVGVAIVYWVSLVRILNRAGYSGWWSLLTLVPLVNIYALWRFSRARWPALDRP